MNAGPVGPAFWVLAPGPWVKYRSSYADDVPTWYPTPGTRGGRRPPTADRLNVREPSRARTETGSRGEYGAAENGTAPTGDLS